MYVCIILFYTYEFERLKKKSENSAVDYNNNMHIIFEINE